MEMINAKEEKMKKELWDIYTATAERQSLIRDQYGRSPHALAKHSPSSPVVSRHLHREGFRPGFPGGKNWGVLISHDVDWLNYVGLSGRNLLTRQAKRLLKGQVSAFLRGWVEGKKRRAPEYRLEQLLEAHEKRGIQSSYFFLALEPGEEDFNYQIQEAKPDIKMVLDEGNEAGLHGGHRAYNSLEVILEEKARIEGPIPGLRGYRNHYLRFDIHQTWNLLEKAGFEYDATFGFAGFPGFRNGMCHPFRPYDPGQERFIDIVEFPLHVMDVSLFNYLGLQPDAALELVKMIVEEVRQVNGVFSLLWHNNYLQGTWGDFYLRLLDFLKSLDPCFSTHGQMLDWWKEQGYFGQMEEIMKPKNHVNKVV